VAERDVILAKVATIDRCLGRIADVRGPRGSSLLAVDIEDIVLLNLQRATQAAIDIAAHVVADERLGLPASLGDAFSLLEKSGIIDAGLALRLRKMTGFRNLAVHAYDAVDPAIVEAIVTRHLSDLEAFAAAMLARTESASLGS